MVALRKNSITTLGGLMMAIGGIPQAVQYAHLSFPLPLWWNSCQFPLFLCFLAGSAIVGWAAKGADEHSTAPQMEAATVKAVANEVVTATSAKPAEMPAVPVVIVKPPEGKP